jgi:hypothetical protein
MQTETNAVQFIRTECALWAELSHEKFEKLEKKFALAKTLTYYGGATSNVRSRRKLAGRVLDLLSLPNILSIGSNSFVKVAYSPSLHIP